MSEPVAHVQVVTGWLERGRLRRILRGASLDFTEDRNLFRARFEATLTAEQFDILSVYWSRTPGVHLTKYVVQ